MSLSDKKILDELDDLIPTADKWHPWFPTNGYKGSNASLKNDNINDTAKFKEQYEGTFAIDHDKYLKSKTAEMLNCEADLSCVSSNISIKDLTNQINDKLIKDMAIKCEQIMLKENNLSSYNTAYGMQIPSHTHDISTGIQIPSRVHSIYAPMTIAAPPSDDINIAAGNTKIKICANGDVQFTGTITTAAKKFWDAVSTYAPNNVEAVTNIEKKLEERNIEISTLKAELNALKNSNQRNPAPDNDGFERAMELVK